MPATRTQIYLTPDQRQRIDQVAEAEGITLAEVVRRAVDAYLSEAHVDAEQALATTFGIAPEVTAPGRDEWDRG
jgi:predicted DNA-binding protein